MIYTVDKLYAWFYKKGNLYFLYLNVCVCEIYMSVCVQKNSIKMSEEAVQCIFYLFFIFIRFLQFSMEQIELLASMKSRFFKQIFFFRN